MKYQVTKNYIIFKQDSQITFLTVFKLNVQAHNE